MKHFFMWLVAGIILLTNSQLIAQNNGNKVNIPGKIEASNYTDSEGGRLEDNTDKESFNKHFLGGLRKRHYFLYNVNIKKEGQYKIDYRITGSRKSAIKVSLIDRSGKEQLIENAEFPPTGGWRHWSTFSGKEINLKKGAYKLKVSIISDGLNINWLNIKSLKPIKSVSIPGRVYASDYIDAKGGGLEEATDEKGNQYLGGIKKGNYFIYAVHVKNDGKYVFNYRTTGNRRAVLNLSIIGKQDVEQKLETMPLPSTEGWRNWKTFQGTIIQLKKGEYKLKISVVDDGFSLNWLDIRPLEPYTIPGRIKFTNYSEGVGGKYENNSDIDEGQQLAGLRAKNYFIYDVKVTNSGTYQLDVRLTSQTVGKIKISLSEDKQNFYEAGIIELYSPVGWKNWDTLTAGKVALNKKIKQIKIEVLQDGFMLNWIEFKPIKN